MNKQILIVLLALVAISCKKETNKPEEKVLNLQGSYYSSTTMEFSAPVMYTQAGIVTDAAVIKSYLSRKKVTDVFNFDANTQTVQADLLNINIDANAKVTGKMYVGGLASKLVDVDAFVASQSPTDALIQASKSNVSFIYGGGFGLGTSIGKTQPIFDYSAISSAAGGGGYLITSPQFRMVIKNGELYRPELAFYFYYTVKNGAAYGSSILYDTVNPNLSRELFSKDTVVVQQRLVKLLK